MSDDTTNHIPEFNAMALLQARLASKGVESKSSTADGNIDPYQLMLRRKKENAEGAIASIQAWPDADVKRLEEFCLSHGIIGFNCGKMNPIAALSFLKQKLGVIENPSRNEGYGPNYPYTEAMKKRILLQG